MKQFPQKVRDARAALQMSQPELAAAAGVSLRSVVAYEAGEKYPRQGTMLRLAKALQVSVRFLSDDACTDPMEEIERDGYIEEARKQYGGQGARDLDALLQENVALFAGGDLSQDQKDAFFEAVMNAYVLSKQQAREKFGKKE